MPAELSQAKPSQAGSITGALHWRRQEQDGRAHGTGDNCTQIEQRRRCGGGRRGGATANQGGLGHQRLHALPRAQATGGRRVRGGFEPQTAVPPSNTRGFKKFGRGPFPARQNRRAGPGQSQYPQQGAPSPKRNGWSSASNGITRPTLFGGDTPFGTTVGSI
jgi:hypothetical protein